MLRPPRTVRASCLAISALVVVLVATLLSAGPALAIRKANHDGWPTVTGALIINSDENSRPIDMRTGADPFSGTDPGYRCNMAKRNNRCFFKIRACRAANSNFCVAPPVIPASAGRLHHELLGAGGDDVIHGGDGGDIIWGDHRYPENPVTQVDKIYGGAGEDYIYVSHGRNEIHTGGGADHVFARTGRGEIHCDSPNVQVRLSKRTLKRFKLYGCKNLSFEPIGTQEHPDR